MNMKRTKLLSIIVFIAFISSATTLIAEPLCGELTNLHGPWDYTDPIDRMNLDVVERGHFTKDVEQLIAGASTVNIAGDLDYTLRAFPNHHRALNALSKLTLREKTPKPRGAKRTTLCYFERAVRFKPDDPMVRSLFSNHLLKINKQKLALEQLLVAAELEPNNPTTNYNLGLLYLKMKNFDKALFYAKKAYAQGFPLPGLKKQLTAAGKWK